MKTGTEYRKRNYRITQDEDKQTEKIEFEEIEKVFSQSLQTQI